ncbi:MAG TPA: regulatory iron-sulfur-containing complex subunit RicT [Thermodesulfovibrionales bacterium]|nr:regulatory iron-sulfur-containing complex subunit RicT [Thermodesulfovibrionales bacterium]
MPDIAGIRFKPCGKIYDFETDGVALRKGDLVVVESELGVNIGTVVNESSTIEDSGRKLKKIIRRVTEEDLKQQEENKKLEQEAKVYCLERIMARGLPMKLISTEATLDKKRIIFYFTAEKRIDFRELVKDLASRFKTRIEMRQIGVRDGARIIGSLGVCGRELCCAKFLIAFEPISIKMAKKQELVLNTGKLSGVCGRLMCCLGYEYSERGTGDKALQDGELAVSSEEEQVEEVVAELIDSPEEEELSLRDDGPVPEGAEEADKKQHGAQAKKDKHRKWHPKRRRRKFNQKKSTP